MATKIQLETRIRELERRLENDEQDMVEVCDRIEKLEQKNNDICGVIYDMTWPHNRAKIRERIHYARIDTGDTEAQDEPQSSKDVSDGRDSTPPMVSTGGAEVESVSVDAIMGELREASAKRFIPEVTYSVKRFIDLDVRPHIEKLVGEIRLKNIFLRGKEGCEQEMIKAIEAKELAEAEVARLRDLLKRMPHLSEMHEGYVNLVEKALAKYETQKGGNDEQAVRNATLEEVANYISSAWLNAKSNIEIAKIVRQMKESS